MSTYLVDTDWAIQVLHGNQEATQALLEQAEAGLSLSLISYGELFEGAYYARDSQRALTALQTFLDGKELLPPTTAIMERFAILRGQLPRQIRRQVGDLDLLIGATALEYGLRLFTYNRKDFAHIPGLSLA